MKERLHQRISELETRLNRGQLSRREFLRATLLLGVSLGASEVLGACKNLPTTPALPTAYEPYVDDPALLTAASRMELPAGASGPEATLAVETGARPTDKPERNVEWLCASCGRRFQTIEAVQIHAGEEHAWRLPEIQRVDEATYSKYLVGEVERFDEKNTVFSRTMWDKDYIAQVMEAMARAPKDDWEDFEGRALVAGAIYVDDSVGMLHPNYYGYFGHQKDPPGLYNWDDPVNPVKFPVPDPSWMTERIREVAHFYGADLVGVTKVDRRWVYSSYFERTTGNHGRIYLPYKYAIVMGIEMDWEGINESPRAPASAATALAYSQMAELSASLAKYIRALGYEAIPCGNDTAQSIPLAIDAGLGELGRNGLLLTPEYGSRQRLCKVFTNLPLQPDQPVDFGIQSFCETCHACAAACPVDAIRWEDRTTEPTSISNRTGILRWPVNVERCFLFWRENGIDCSNCIAACPWALHSQRAWLEE